jgi:Xaa-Pro aminopeptidase
VTAVSSKEAVGQHYSVHAMQYAQQMTWRVIEQIAAQIKPGLRESDAQTIAKQVLADIGMQRIWHPVLIRFGANTLKTFKQRSVGDPVLGTNDIFFIDLGVVFGGHEGDAGATFTTGSDPEMQACAAAAKTLFDRVRVHWRTGGVSGQQLYDYAQAQAIEMGWVLNLDIKGHRVSDFPHAIYRAGDLGNYAETPGRGLWILEIQLAHPTRPFGAFYEDLLV